MILECTGQQEYRGSWAEGDWGTARRGEKHVMQERENKRCGGGEGRNCKVASGWLAAPWETGKKVPKLYVIEKGMRLLIENSVYRK